MNAMLLLLVCAAIFLLGYIFYGRWLAKQWGVEPDRPTPAVEMEDGVDYVAAPPYVVLGHHFSSIAGAGPINGPIQAAVFGWVPVVLWVVIAGIFFGAVQDFGALFASVRNKGKSMAAVIEDNIDGTAKILFCIFAYLVGILVVAAFSSIVANTFASTPAAPNVANEQTASISMLFIIAAVIWGFATRGRSIPAVVNVVAAILTIVVVVAIGYNFHPLQLDYNTWVFIIGAYILIASVAPVWILLQPRDYLSSYLLYAMMILAVVAIVGAGLVGAASNLDIPAFTGFFTTNAAYDAATGEAIINNGVAVVNKSAQGGFLFPALFITIACGAVSGFHSLIASGTTSKQISSEKYIKPISFGSMMIECVISIISLSAVGFVWAGYTAGQFASPTQIFATGISQMLATIPGLAALEPIVYSLLILAVSVFCLTSLDTVTRLSRYLFQELLTPKGKTAEEVTGVRKVLINNWVATGITVVIGVALGLTGYTLVWPLFGAANQLLAAIALLAVCTWLGNAGKNNKMFYIPMVFMLVVTSTSLIMTVQAKVLALVGGAITLANILQFVIAAALLILAVILAVKGARVLFRQRRTA